MQESAVPAYHLGVLKGYLIHIAAPACIIEACDALYGHVCRVMTEVDGDTSLTLIDPFPKSLLPKEGGEPWQQNLNRMIKRREEERKKNHQVNAAIDKMECADALSPLTSLALERAQKAARPAPPAGESCPAMYQPQLQAFGGEDQLISEEARDCASDAYPQQKRCASYTPSPEDIAKSNQQAINSFNAASNPPPLPAFPAARSTHKWTFEEKCLLVRGHDAGEGWEEIAGKIGGDMTAARAQAYYSLLKKKDLEMERYRASPRADTPPEKLIEKHDEYAGKREDNILVESDWPDIQHMLKKGASPIHIRKIAGDYDVPFEQMRDFIDAQVLAEAKRSDAKKNQPQPLKELNYAD